MQTDTLGRRNRFIRTPIGKRMVLTGRDTEIMRWLYRYRYLRATQLAAFINPKSNKRFIERLGDLFHETGLVNRPKIQWRQFADRCAPLIYELSAKGVEFLAGRDQLPHRATTLSRRVHSGRVTQFAHAMMIVDALASVELELIELPDKRFVPVDEILARAPERTRTAKNPLSIPVTIQPSKRFPEIKAPWHTHVIPDGLYGVEYLIGGEKRYRFWALECERTSPAKRGSARHSSLVRKQAAYDALMQSQAYKDHWGIPNLKLDLRTSKKHPPV